MKVLIQHNSSYMFSPSCRRTWWASGGRSAGRLKGAALPSLILWARRGRGRPRWGGCWPLAPMRRSFRSRRCSRGSKNTRAAIDAARAGRQRGKRTVLFIDEIHRFNKGQQDALLPAVETGTVTLVGATTENPSFEVTGALLSRCRVVVLEPLSEHDLTLLIRRALTDPDRGLASYGADVGPELIAQLALGGRRCARGADRPGSGRDRGRSRSRGHPPDHRGRLGGSVGRARFASDKNGEDHYNLASALIKSLRNSDANAALYWLARLIEGGADPLFIARRLCILASEDIGLADPNAMARHRPPRRSRT